ncbi:helicase HerA domain-containing protein [Candidatus Spyradosoma sp. SGI.093]|uniref:helicase HerA domain-containing protein n=1 Tax=Candidatus Spyradosoma sp. SGI.093 TaxID=3420583 RepID=UPI003CFE0B18
MANSITKKLDELDANEREILARDESDRIIGWALARNHLSLPEFSDVVMEASKTSDEAFDVMKYTRFFKVEEIVFESETEVHLPGVESVLSSMRESGHSLVFLVRGTASKTSVYMGVADTFGIGDENAIAAAAESYRAAWNAYFPGMKTTKVFRAEIEKLGFDLRHSLKDIAVLTGIPSLKREESEHSFVQGLERLIRAMRGKSYCWLSIADPIPQSELDEVIRACRALQTDVHRFVKTDVSESKSKGKTAMLGVFGMKGSADTSGEAHSESKSHTDSKTQNFAEAHQRITAGISAGCTIVGGLLGTLIPIPGVGTALGAAIGAAVGTAVGTALGGTAEKIGTAISGKTGHSETVSDTITKTDTISKSLSSQLMGGGFGSVGVTFTDTSTIGQEIVNRKAQYAEETLKAYEDRLTEGVALGMWNLGHYFCAADEETFRRGTGVVRSLFSGMESKYEPPRAIRMPSDFGKVLSRFRNVYLRFKKTEGGKDTFTDHPLGIFFNGPGTPVNTRELAIATPVAMQDVEGVTVTKRPGFGVNFSARAGESVVLGKILEKGNDVGQEYAIATTNFPKHLAVFGLTGSGKTNTVHCLLRRFWKKTGVPFLVIEPAKAEYRALANREELGEKLLVFSAGSDTTDACPLRLNPFAFDPGEDTDARRVHVLTHIDRLKATFNASFPMYASMPYILEEAILDVYRDRGWDLGRSRNRYVDIYREDFSDYVPTLEDLYWKIDAVVKRKGYFNEQEQNIRAALKARISSLMVGAKGSMFNCARSLSAKELFENPVVIELENMGDDDEKAFLMGLLVSRLYEYRKATFTAEPGEAKARHVLVIEEAHRLLSNIPAAAESQETANVKGKAVSAFVDMLAEIRAMGQSVIVADQLPSRVSPNIVKGTGTKIVHRLLAKDDRESVGETMGLNEEQIDDLCLLRTGECVVNQDGDAKAYMCRVKKDECHDERKGGEVSEATRKFRAERAAIFALRDAEVDVEDTRFRDDLHKAMLAVGLGEDGSALLENVRSRGRFAEPWREKRHAWFDVHWERICSELWSRYGGDYKALLELEKRGREAFVSIGDEMSAGALDEYRRAFKAYFSETKAFLYRLSGSDDLAGIVYGHLGILQNVNGQYDRFAHLADKNERLARAIERALPSLAPSGADLPQILQERIVRGLLDEIPAEISKDMILARLFGGKGGI